MHKIIEKKFYLGPKFGTLFNKKWITISELLQPMALEPLIYIGVKAHEDYGPRKEPAEGRLEYGNCIINRHRYNLYHTRPRL
jgi:hypothetical protein